MITTSRHPFTTATRPAPGARLGNGRFARQRDPITLYEIVRVVAAEAARRHPDPLKDPRTITQKPWNSARRAYSSVYGHIPRAHEVTRQLSDRDGQPFPWRQLLELVFDDTRDITK